MRILFALIVAINSYHQDDINDLNGCLNDLDGINSFLEAHCNKEKDLNLKLHKTILKNENATRQAVINEFKMFESAQDNDVCLFYFSGHGAQIDAPKEFWHESDRKLEAIVCHAEKGNDNLLIDKELSFLIANAQKDKEIHFIVITDSCHSGSNTKDNTFKVRSVSPNINTRKVDAYLGRSDYDEIKNDEGKVIGLSVPIGKHLKLAACTNSELAKEKNLGNDRQIQGIFTYSILEVLKSNGYNLSYLNLINKVRIKAQSLTRNQSPQLELISLYPQESNRTFLNGLLEGDKPTFQISYNKEENRWEINVGSIYGIQENDVAVLNDNQQVEIKTVNTTCSILEGIEALNSYDTEKIYDGIVIPKSRKKLNIWFSQDSNENARKTFIEFFKEITSPFIELNPDKDIDYIIRAVEDVFALTHPEGYIPVFSRIKGQDKSEARKFLNIVERIAEWHYILSINNPNSRIKESEIKITLSKVEKPHTQENPDSSEAILIDNEQEDNVFCYYFDENHPKGPWHPPFFRLSITNNSQTRKFWVTALYCGVDYIPDKKGYYTSTAFSITNRFLRKEELNRGHVAKMTDEIHEFNTNRRIEYESIQLSLLDDYFDQGYNEIKDTIKIFISTEEIDSSPFNTDGIPIDVEGVLSEKQAGRPILFKPKLSDWCTFEIPITIVKPRDLGIIDFGQSKSFYGVTIAG